MTTRKALQPRQATRVRNGVPIMPRRRKGSARPTLEQVNRLRDEYLVTFDRRIPVAAVVGAEDRLTVIPA